MVAVPEELEEESSDWTLSISMVSSWLEMGVMLSGADSLVLMRNLGEGFSWMVDCRPLILSFGSSSVRDFWCFLFFTGGMDEALSNPPEENSSLL